MIDNFTVMVGCSSEENFVLATRNIVNHVETRWVNGNNMPSFSYLVNQCIIKCPTEGIIFCSDRVRPQPHHVDKVIEMVEEGYGWAGPFRWAFTGFYKQLIRDIGFLDERYLGGGLEDSDFILRCMEYNISYFETEDPTLNYQVGMSRWHKDLSKVYDHHAKKWGQDADRKIYIKTLHDEELYDRSILGPERPDLKAIRLPWSDEYTMPAAPKGWKAMTQSQYMAIMQYLTDNHNQVVG